MPVQPQRIDLSLGTKLVPRHPRHSNLLYSQHNIILLFPSLLHLHPRLRAKMADLDTYADDQADHGRYDGKRT
jgi:hypothetical protein